MPPLVFMSCRYKQVSTSVSHQQWACPESIGTNPYSATPSVWFRSTWWLGEGHPLVTVHGWGPGGSLLADFIMLLFNHSASLGRRCMAGDLGGACLQTSSAVRFHPFAAIRLGGLGEASLGHQCMAGDQGGACLQTLFMLLSNHSASLGHRCMAGDPGGACLQTPSADRLHPVAIYDWVVWVFDCAKANIIHGATRRYIWFLPSKVSSRQADMSFSSSNDITA